MSEKFRKIPPFEFCGFKAWAGVAGDTDQAIVIGDAHMAVSRARELRNWLTAALPCEHKGVSRGTGTFGPGGTLKMTCDECGAEVPSHVGMLGF